MKISIVASLAILFALAIIGLVQGESCDGKTYSYDPNSATGPANWGGICDGWEICGKGLRQSPIDLKNDTRQPIFVSTSEFSKLSTNYDTITTTTYNSESKKIVGVRVNYDDKFLFFGGNKTDEGNYQLKDIRIRTPSEHTIDGKRFSAEIQLVHERDSDNRVAIISVLVNALSVQPDPFLQTLIDNIIPKIGDESKEYRANFADILPPSLNYYYYQGSLTAPPCTENVEWYVLDQTILANLAQMNHFSFYQAHGNSRPVQTVNEDGIKVYNFQDNRPPNGWILVSILSIFSFLVVVFVIAISIVNKILHKNESIDVFDPTEHKSLIDEEISTDLAEEKEDEGYQAGAYQTDI